MSTRRIYKIRNPKTREIEHWTVGNGPLSDLAHQMLDWVEQFQQWKNETAEIIFKIKGLRRGTHVDMSKMPKAPSSDRIKEILQKIESGIAQQLALREE